MYDLELLYADFAILSNTLRTWYLLIVRENFYFNMTIFLVLA